ncbi:hypothetical protein C2869_00935 [Saccharobesus litoralis]|uniref:Beta propeller domain-containing protein n=1 Tax=Saccharobesus litoralis TaxID=2172099 RepID=A0A2S0VLL0_9ALTE|nr:beta-propeller domain-containing protein [Saccharobesus litoralis]AWB65092.1 hypothetical protein C2869_00935 [Saccharobesus litoralis]
MKSYKYNKIALAIMTTALAVTLVNCGGSSSSDSDDNNGGTGPSTFEVIQLSEQTPTLAKLRKAQNADETLTRIKNSLLVNSNHNYIFNTKTRTTFDTTSAPASADGNVENAVDSLNDDAGFSSTNLIEQGVDEADFVKYDGESLFISVNHTSDDLLIEPRVAQVTAASSPIAPDVWYPQDFESFIRVMQKDEFDVMQEVTRIDSPSDHHSYQNIYLSNDKLTAFATKNTWGWTYDDWRYPGIWQNGSVDIVSFDVADASQPAKLHNVSISGYLVRSRRIGNKLYVVSQFSPAYPAELDYAPQTKEDYKKNVDLVNALSSQQLFPTITINDAEPVALGDMATCYLPDNSDEHSSYGNVLSVTVFDVDDLTNYSTSCLNTYTDGFYMSQNAIYLTSQVYNEGESSLAIHKLDVTDTGVEYTASGSVPGYLGWRGVSFKMNEKDDLFRVITTKRTGDPNDNFDHQLFVLQTNEQQSSLEPIAQLPNDTYPKKIGKDNEDIYAVRFIGDKAYVVTFERIDPLYVIDLSQPNDPKITGELEIPGFSTYLHPLDDNHILGIGEDATGRFGEIINSSLADESSDSQTPSHSVTQGEGGIKFGIFNISDINNPIEVQSLVLGDSGSRSEALYEHKAISMLKTSDSTFRLAIPSSISQKTADRQWGTWQYSGLETFNIDLTNTTQPLAYNGAIKAEQRSDDKRWRTYGSNGRGVIHNDQLFYVHGHTVWSALWQSPESATVEQAVMPAQQYVVESRGILQCQGGGTSLADSAQKLTDANVSVIGSKCMGGLAVPAVCGASTGELNAHQINTVDLSTAIQLGFSKASAFGNELIDVDCSPITQVSQ